MPALPCPQTFPFSVSRPLPCRRIFLHYSWPGTAPPAGFPLKRPSNASFTRRTFRCNCRTASSPPPALRPSLPDKAHPSAHATDTAMARARRRSRAPEGRTERRSRRGHHPGHRPGKVRADAPRDTRRAGYSPTQETIFALPQKGEYGGAGGVEGSPPLTPCPAPGRRPAARAGQQPQAEAPNITSKDARLYGHHLPHAGQQPQAAAPK